MKPLRWLIPGTIRARLLLLVLGAVLAAQAATLYTLSVYQRDHAQTVAVDLIATTIRTLQTAMSGVAPSDRAEFVQRTSLGQWRLWSHPLPAGTRMHRMPRGAAGQHALPGKPNVGTPGQSGGNSQDDLRRSLRGLVANLNNRLGKDTRVAMSRGPHPELYLSLPTSEPDTLPREWLVIPIDRIDPPYATSAIVWWSAGIALILLLAAGFSWHIARPITRLAQATNLLASGTHERVKPSGPDETRKLGESFNAMLDALEESDKVRRTLLAGLPHDLKGPLSRMWLRIEMADDPALKDGLRKDLKDMQQMVDQFIGFVRGTDPATYRFSNIDLSEWLPERVSNWSAADPKVQLVEPIEPIRVTMDPEAMSRLLDNLIGNALQHGAPPVIVSLAKRGERAVLSVSDHGNGIPAGQVQDAMRPFVRLDEARTRTGSVGLGLALVEAITKAHGGKLSLSQHEAGGLHAEVSLPICLAS